MKCYGCGAEAATHPIVGVINKKDVEDPEAFVVIQGAGDFVGVPVCTPCHVDPAHREAHALKCHFFEAGKQAQVGVVLAGSADLGGPAR